MNNLSNQCITNTINGLLNLKSVINSSNYLKIYAKLLDNAKTTGRKIIITGLGKNSHIAAKISDTMVSLGIDAMYLDTVHYFHGNAGYISTNDIIINISRSGKTEELINLMKHMSIINPDVIQILIHCNEHLNTDEYDIDHYIYCGKVIESDEFNLAPTTSTTVLLTILDIISIQLSHDLGFSEKDFLKYHPGGALGKLLKSKYK